MNIKNKIILTLFLFLLLLIVIYICKPINSSDKSKIQETFYQDRVFDGNELISEYTDDMRNSIPEATRILKVAWYHLYGGKFWGETGTYGRAVAAAAELGLSIPALEDIEISDENWENPDGSLFGFSWEGEPRVSWERNKPSDETNAKYYSWLHSSTFETDLELSTATNIPEIMWQYHIMYEGGGEFSPAEQMTIRGNGKFFGNLNGDASLWYFGFLYDELREQEAYREYFIDGTGTEIRAIPDLPTLLNLYGELFDAKGLTGNELNNYKINISFKNAFIAAVRNPDGFVGEYNLSNWDTSNVTDMSNLFIRETDIHDNINKVQRRAFNQDISMWDVSNVIDMENMFRGCKNFDQNLSSWNVSKVKNMNRMFYKSEKFNQDLSNWNTSSLESMKEMFAYAIEFNNGGVSLESKPVTSPSNYQSWNLTNVTNMEGLFRRATKFNQPINNWTTSGVTTMSHMFVECVEFNQPLSSWDTQSVLSMSHMFSRALEFNQDLSNFKTSSVTDMDDMFYKAYKYNNGGVPLNSWNVQNVTSMEAMFCLALKFNQPFTFNNTSNLENVKYMFGNVEYSYIDKYNLDENGDIILDDDGDRTRIKVRDYKNSFCYSIFNQNINNFDTSNVNNMEGLFFNSQSFNNGGEPLNINTSLVTNMYSMFKMANVFNQPISFVTNNVTNMKSMFENARVFNQDISNFNVSNVTDMAFMFSHALMFNNNDASLTWDTSRVRDMESMFENARSFNQDISGWITSSVGNMNNMFKGAVKFNQNISRWNTCHIGYKFNEYDVLVAVDNSKEDYISNNLLFSTNSAITQSNKPDFDQDSCGLPENCEEYDINACKLNNNCISKFNTNSNLGECYPKCSVCDLVTNARDITGFYGSISQNGTSPLNEICEVNPDYDEANADSKVAIIKESANIEPC
jgi:surface protein